MAVIEEVVESAPSSSDSAPGGKLAEGREQEMAGAPVSDDADDLEAIEPEYDMLKAQDAKALGNSHYSAADWQLAADAYTEAIMWAPPEAEEKAVYHCNRAACYVKLGQWDAVVDDCTSALEAQPRYVKALSRRMQAFEALDKPTEALGDARLLAEIESTAAARATVSRLEKVEAEKLEREKEEMMGKLKDLGNMFLGNFGLSVNNFKATKDESTGSYNISYDPNA
ncbi:hypothetical protein KFE25_000063 [Diacronema lutheri]|uniref:Uncharacterized protein n=1 Tax=Diacronema lutheri TaxID=2081491 RepID=A0A8J6CBN9_DIALT|nr:hypothetical protein KFE25_000063 [Diacronema lutheri]